MTEKVLCRIDSDGGATVTLNRPDVHNAFDRGMVNDLTHCLRKLGADAAVRAVVIAGAGKSFCAGADIAHMRASAAYTRRDNLRAARESARMFHALWGLGKPTIACVHGAARGGGLGLVAACDIAIAGRNATFRLSEVKLGIIPAMISPYVVAAIGERNARRYMLSGEEFNAADALRIGLVHEVADENELAARLARMLGHLRSSGPHALAAVKQLIPFVARRPLGAAIVEATARRIAAIRATPEAQEGLSAFLEKRPPAWIAPRAPALRRRNAKTARTRRR